MQIEDYLLTSTIDGVLAQRLVRRLCPHCRTPYRLSQERLHVLGLDRLNATPETTLYRANGCDTCDHTGYRGRISVLELMLITEPLRRAIIARADADALRELAEQEGMHDMRVDGLRKALSGLTSIEEVERVTQAGIAAD